MGPGPEERRPGDGGATGEYRSGWGGSVTGPRNAAGSGIRTAGSGPRNAPGFDGTRNAAGIGIRAA